MHEFKQTDECTAGTLTAKAGGASISGTTAAAVGL
jgi:hypothetical protein